MQRAKQHHYDENDDGDGVYKDINNRSSDDRSGHHIIGGRRERLDDHIGRNLGNIKIYHIYMQK